jgi:hypothetical protein
MYVVDCEPIQMYLTHAVFLLVTDRPGHVLHGLRCSGRTGSQLLWPGRDDGRQCGKCHIPIPMLSREYQRDWDPSKNSCISIPIYFSRVYAISRQT